MAARHAVCAVSDIAPGEKRIIKIGSRSIGVFNVDGEFYALLNLCPHKAANLCEGIICGTNKTIDIGKHGYHYEYVMVGEVLRCARHGWEFNIRNGESLIDSSIKAKTYPTEIQDGQIFVLI